MYGLRCFRQLFASLAFAASLFLFVFAASGAQAQQVQVQNSATLKVSNSAALDLEEGTMDLGDSGSDAILEESSQGRVAGGSLTATRSLNGPSAEDAAGLGLEISTGGDLGEVTLTRGHSVQTDGSGSESIERYLDVSATGTDSGLDATLTLHYSDEELNGLSESELEFFRSDDGGNTWEQVGQDSRDASTNTVTVDGVSSFTRWTLGSESDPLPVELASFEGTHAGDSQVSLRWQTASETGSAAFRVQHRETEESPWNELGYVASKAEGGTSTVPLSYRFTAEDLGVGTHQFRLEQVDIDGTTHAHDPIRVTLGMQKATQLSTPAPNPVSGRAAVSFAVKEETETQVTLYNVLGQKVATLYEGTPQAEEEQILQIDASALASGVYVMRLETGGKIETRRVTVVR